MTTIDGPLALAPVIREVVRQLKRHGICENEWQSCAVLQPTAPETWCEGCLMKVAADELAAALRVLGGAPTGAKS